MKKSVILYLILFYVTSCGKQQTINENDLVKVSNENVENLNYIIKVLSEDIPNYEYMLSLYGEKGFIIRDNKIIGLNIYDLTTGERFLESLQEGHIYHVSPKNYQNSLSYIFCVFDSKFVVFKTINCENYGHSLNDVLTYMKNRGVVNSKILNRIKNYRDYGDYLRIDAQTYIKCPKNR